MSIEQDAIHTVNLKHGITAYVVPDDDAQSPATWDNVGLIACKNRWPFDTGSLLSEESFEELLQQVKDGALIGVPVDVQDYGSRGVRVVVQSDLDDCDALFYCTPQKAIEEWGSASDKLATILAEALTQECKARAEKCMASEVETWQQYFEGDVYSVVVHDSGGKVLDSCCGYYGSDYAKSEAKQMGDACVATLERERRAGQRRARKERAERTYWSFRGVVTA